MSKPDGDPTLVDHSGIGVDIGGSFAKLVYFRYEQQTSWKFSATPLLQELGVFCLECLIGLAVDFSLYTTVLFLWDDVGY